MRSHPTRERRVVLAAAARAFNAAADVLVIPMGSFSSALVIVTVTAHAGDATVTPTFLRGDAGQATFAGDAYVPPEGAFGALGANGTTTRRLSAEGDLQLTLTHGGTAGTNTVAVIAILKHADVA